MLLDIALWTFAAICSLLGCIFVPLWGTVTFLLMCVIAIILMSIGKKQKINEKMIPPLFISTGLAMTMFGIIGSSGWCSILMLAWAVLSFIISIDFDKNRIEIAGFSNVCIAVMGIFISLFVWWDIDSSSFSKRYRGENWRSQTTYICTENIMNTYNQTVLQDNLFTDKQKQKLRNPANAQEIFDEINNSYTAKLNDAHAKKDSLFNVFYKQKQADFEAVHQQFSGKTEILTIKRLWLNGDVVPWTYDAWTSINLTENTRLHNSLFTMSYRHTTSLNINGKASYVGDLKLDYINIVLSDNSFVQFNIKDHPEWLLARVGEKVEVKYEHKKDEGIHFSLIDETNKPDFDRLYLKYYNPIFQ